MKAARLMEPYKIVLEEAPVPQITPDEVLLKIICFGICASDQQIYHGKHKYAAMPVVMGHELTAVVQEAGSAVTGFKAGDKVTVEPQVYCGACTPCKQGRFNVCENLKVIGVHLDGGNREYMAIDPKYLHLLPSELDDEVAALVEPLSVGVGSIKRSRMFRGGNVVVMGAGTIGNLTAQAAKGLGAGKVLICDILQEKLDYALECGIDFAANTAKIPLEQAILDAFGPQKADVIVDCVAAPALFESILQAARPNSEIIMTGNYKEPVRFEVPLMQRREISLIGHMMYVREDYADAIRLLSEGRINTTKVISQRYVFADYPKAFVFADEHPEQVMKMIVRLHDRN